VPRRLLIAATLLVAVSVGVAGLALGRPVAAHPPSRSPCGRDARAPVYKHVIVLFEENNSYASIYKSSSAPYINSVISACGLATNYHNVTHPSLPNYVAATTGASLPQLLPFVSDCTPSVACQWTGNNIFNEVNGKGGWKGYAESMPTNCDRSDVGLYAPRHNPAVYATDLSNCASRDLPLGTLASSPLLKDFSKEKTAPAFAWITPNLCDDMHGAPGCPSNLIQTGDNWLKMWLPRITSTAVYRSGDTAILIAWDEGEPGVAGEDCAASTSDQSCHVVAIVVAPSVRAHTRVSALFNHYSLLKTAEDLLHLRELGGARTAAGLSRAFNL
jgi:phosphatidylinositol-3-phosphatase